MELPGDDYSERVKPAPEPVPPADGPDFTHYVHLADGRVIRHYMAEPLGTYYREADDGSDEVTNTQIIGVYPR